MRDAIAALVAWQRKVPARSAAAVRRCAAAARAGALSRLVRGARVRRHLDRGAAGASGRTPATCWSRSALAQPTRRGAPRLHAAQPDGRRCRTPASSTSRTRSCGPIAYDVASLLRDAFISWDEEQELDWAVRYWEAARQAGLPLDADFGEFWRELEWMGLQRHLKVLGIFCRLKHRDGKPAYSEDLPRFFAYAHKVATRYSPLRPLARLLEPLMGATTHRSVPLTAHARAALRPPPARAVPARTGRRLPEPRHGRRRRRARVLRRAAGDCATRWSASRRASCCANSCTRLVGVAASEHAVAHAGGRGARRPHSSAALVDDLVFVDNATAGVNAVLRSLDLAPGRRDPRHRPGLRRRGPRRRATSRAAARARWCTTVALPYTARRPATTTSTRSRARSRRARASPCSTTSPRRARSSCRSRELAARMPRARRRRCSSTARTRRARSRSTSPALGVDWYAANLHKWACAPRSCGFLWATPERQATAASAGDLVGPRPAALTQEFDWIGTRDPTPWLAAPAAHRVHEQELGVRGDAR